MNRKCRCSTRTAKPGRFLCIKSSPERFVYTDLAMRIAGDSERLELFGSAAAQAYVGEQRRLKDLRDGRGADRIVDGTDMLRLKDASSKTATVG
jgi:hypothetical protein